MVGKLIVEQGAIAALVMAGLPLSRGWPTASSHTDADDEAEFMLKSDKDVEWKLLPGSPLLLPL